MDEFLALPESKTLEFKRDLSSPEGILKALIAFANTAGGRLIIGVEDKTKQVVGVLQPLALEESLASMIVDSIEPRLIPNIEIVPYRNLYLLSIEVYPSNTKPHYLKRKGLEAGAYIRVGSTNRLADAVMLQELGRYSRLETYDNMPIPELSDNDLDFDALAKCFSPYRQLKPADCQTLKLVVQHQGRFVPTVGGMILFGKERLLHFPDAWIQVGVFKGDDKSTLIDTTDILDFPPYAVSEALKFVEKHSMRSYEISGIKRKELVSLPIVALREAIINAVVHADYSQRGSPIRISIFSDRVEITNPGLMLAGLTLEDMYRGISKLRNPVIGRVFHELKLVERWGSGVGRMMAACDDQGFSPPQFEELGSSFNVTFYTNKASRSQPKKVHDARDGLILEWIRSHGASTTQDIAKHLGVSTRAARSRLVRLIEGGLIVEVRMSQNDPKKTYKLSGMTW